MVRFWLLISCLKCYSLRRTISCNISVSKICVFEKLIEKLKETFKLYSEDKGGYITQGQFGTIMRSHHQSPTEASLQEILDEFESPDELIDLPKFLNLMSM
ncbi:unnamed protein product [Moneuplotes crassus]|uniref:Calmodulin n=1 Tax=Euplotes crassus TaxID=5936 RepID=A0AAD1Y0E3_EUPCR|nr:unnamed protein product [Moneuplotes crassus]